MTRKKDLKRLVRTRMKKTGEAYTAARAQITRKSKPAKPAATPRADYATLAGMSDDKIREKTGCTWERWVRSLDYQGAEKMAHRDIARLVNEIYKVDGWWSQTVTVGYERIKGLRARGQRRDGTYEVGKSRTYDVPVSALFDAWSDEKLRSSWLNGAKPKLRTATRPKSMRLGWSDGSIVAVGFVARGRGKSTVSLAHMKLPDKDTANRLKQYWAERLDALGEVLAAR